MFGSGCVTVAMVEEIEVDEKVDEKEKGLDFLYFLFALEVWFCIQLLYNHVVNRSCSSLFEWNTLSKNGLSVGNCSTPCPPFFSLLLR